MSRKKEKEIVRGVTVESVGAEGKTIAHIDGKVVFVSNAVPGDVIAVRIDKRREKYFEGTLVEIEQPSPDRLEPFCEHYKDCGGCAWQELPYPLQLKYKQQQVVDQFARIGHLPMEQVEVLPILPSERTTEYRNKLEFTFSDRRWLQSGEDPSSVFDPPTPLDPSQFEGGVFPRHLRGGYSSVNTNPVGFALGFHISKAFDKILDIRHCWLQPEPSNEIRNFIRQYAIVHGLPFFNIREQSGFLRNIIIRTNLKGEVMLTIMFGAHPPRLGWLQSGFKPSDCVDLYNPKTVQATMGSIFRQRAVTCDLNALVRRCTAAGIPVYATALDGEDIRSTALDTTRALILMGSERDGLSPALMAAATRRLHIPSFASNPDGAAESLNVAIATAVTCYEFRRR